MNTSFRYHRACRIPYRNCLFDSLLELKYALMIEKDCRYLREPFKIGFDPKTLLVTSYLREDTKIYTPDFLVRSKSNGQAWLIEIKPSAFGSWSTIEKYKQIAHQYIRQHQLDCQFQIVDERDIRLLSAAQDKFNLFVKYKNKFTDLFALQHLDGRYNNGCVKYFSRVPAFPEDPLNKKEYARFVRTGYS